MDSFRGMVSEGKIRPQGPLSSPLAEIEAALVQSKPPAPQLRKVRGPDLEASWFPPKRWRLTFRGTWVTQEHICIQEARTAVKLMKHLGRSSAGCRHRTLAFTDNQAVLGVLGKGRSSAPALLRLARIAASLALGLEIRVLWRYIRSEVNPADGPSRALPVGPAPATIAEHAARGASLPSA